MRPATGTTPLIAIAAAAVDTETTGLDATKARILRIGAIGILQGRIERDRRFDVLVDPGESVPPNAPRIHGITGNRLGGQPISPLRGLGSRSSSDRVSSSAIPSNSTWRCWSGNAG